MALTDQRPLCGGNHCCAPDDAPPQACNAAKPANRGGGMMWTGDAGPAPGLAISGIVPFRKGEG
jgi:hypothetical protein